MRLFEVSLGIVLLLLGALMFAFSAYSVWIRIILVMFGILFCWEAIKTLSPKERDDRLPGRPALVAKRVTAATVYHYRCLLCGYKWSWRTGTTKPAPTGEKKDLLALGAQRLEEDEGRHRQQEAAAALFHQQQQRRRHGK